MNKLTEKFFVEARNVFTLADVATAIEGSDFCRHGLIKRAIAAGEILHIRRELYCLAPKYQKKPVSAYSLAAQIYGPGYISLETALSYHGWIPEAVYACTCVSSKPSRQFETPLGIFSYKHIPQKILYVGVERHKNENGNVFFMAKPAKALTDYIYIHRLNWKSPDEAAKSLRIDSDELISVNPQDLSDLMENYSNKKIRQFLTGWLKMLKL
jgi:predicted transcriptional regulator of viral defense system